MKTPTEHLVDEVKNWSFDDWKVLRDDPKLLSSILNSVQKAAPEVFENVLRTVMIPPAMNNPEVNSILGEFTPDNTENLYMMSPEELSKRREEDRARWAETDFKAGSPEHLAYIEKQNPGTLEKWASNKMKEAAEHLRGSNEHFGEEQAEGLDNLLEGLRDTPHDNRW